MGKFSKLLESSVASKKDGVKHTPKDFDPNEPANEVPSMSLKKDTISNLLPDNNVLKAIQDLINTQGQAARNNSHQQKIIAGQTDFRDGMQHSAPFVQLGFSNSSSKVL